MQATGTDTEEIQPLADETIPGTIGDLPGKLRQVPGIDVDDLTATLANEMGMWRRVIAVVPAGVVSQANLKDITGLFEHAKRLVYRGQAGGREIPVKLAVQLLGCGMGFG